MIDTFQQLNETGCVEFLDETYHHSLAFLYSREEFRAQVELHRELIKELFGQEPRVFRNTELIYNNDLAHFVSHMGYDAILTEGADHILGYRSPNFVYRPPHAPRLKLLLKNYRLSDDIAFRFSNRDWEQWPLTAEKFARWVNQINGHGFVCNLFMDYETFGEHQWADTGIFDFLRHLPGEVMQASPDNNFLTPSQVIDALRAGRRDRRAAHDLLGRHRARPVRVARQRDAVQRAARAVQARRPAQGKGRPASCSTTGGSSRRSDHFYYMCTKYWADGDVHKYFSPYESPYDSYINFMNVLDNVQTKIAHHECESREVRRFESGTFWGCRAGRERRPMTRSSTDEKELSPKGVSGCIDKPRIHPASSTT